MFKISCSCSALCLFVIVIKTKRKKKKPTFFTTFYNKYANRGKQRDKNKNTVNDFSLKCIISHRFNFFFYYYYYLVCKFCKKKSMQCLNETIFFFIHFISFSNGKILSCFCIKPFVNYLHTWSKCMNVNFVYTLLICSIRTTYS